MFSDNVCIESMSCTISRRSLDNCTSNLEVLAKRVDEAKQSSGNRLKEEYKRLVEGLKKAKKAKETDEILANPS